jgi:UDP-N-acetylglucosamine diphosphorylase/glucosamine-1-phosphate N-acetyltransferase
MTGNLILFEDHFLDDMRPAVLTRPAFAVTCAAWNLHEIARLASDRVGHIVRAYLRKSTARSFQPAAPGDGPTLFLNASVVPDVRYAEALSRMLLEAQPFLCAVGQRVAAALLPPAAEMPPDLTAESVTPWLLGHGLPLRKPSPFQTMDYPFHLVKYLAGLFPANIERRIAAGRFRAIQAGVFASEGVTLAPTAVLHADEGPIVLDEGVQVMDFVCLRGPLYIGPRSRIIERADVKECVSIGHTCKIGGEVEASVIEPYTNKQHHGFLGHSYVGSWVNLGAGTSNSDLKNTYGEVRIEHRGQRLDTGMQFLGCVIGDYSKSAINTSIFTGKIIGASSMLYGYVGQNVPSFCNYAKSFGQVTEVLLEQAIVTQKRMFARRKVAQTEDDIALLTAIHGLTREERMISSDMPVL